MLDYILIMKAACNRLGESCVPDGRALDSWVQEALSHPEICVKMPQQSPLTIEAEERRNLDLCGALLQRSNSFTQARSSRVDGVGSPGGGRSPGKHGIDQSAPSSSPPSPPKRARTDAADASGMEHPKGKVPTIPALRLQEVEPSSDILGLPSPCRSNRGQRAVIEEGNRSANSETLRGATAPAAPIRTAFRGHAVPAAFAMDSVQEPTEEISPPCSPAQGAQQSAWQGSALFAPLPASPLYAPPLHAGPSAAPGAKNLLNAPGTVIPARLAPGPNPGTVTASPVPARRLETPQDTPGSSVQSRIALFEKQTSAATPSMKPPGARFGSSDGTGGKNGSSLFEPIPAATGSVRPKELFRSVSEAGKAAAAKQAPAARPAPGWRPSGQPALASQVSNASAPSSSSCTTADLRRGEDAFGRLAAGTRRDDVAKPRSLIAAEQAKLNEERRLREKQEQREKAERDSAAAASAAVAAALAVDRIVANDKLELARDLAKASKVQEQAHRDARQQLQQQHQQTQPQQLPLQPQQQLQQSQQLIQAPQPPQQPKQLLALSTAQPAASAQQSQSSRQQSQSSQSQPLQPQQSHQQGPKQPSAAPKKASRRSATMPAAEAPPLADAAGPQKAVRPPVPVFSESVWGLRHVQLAPKLPEDNYEISEHGDNSDDEAVDKDRSGKFVPKWNEAYLQELEKQADVDPDTVFGGKVPQCVLEAIFTDDVYKKVGKPRPKRARGSSADWQKDRLTRTEIRDYKKRMGQHRAPDMKPGMP